MSSDPASACALPMRPPFCRYSSVSTVKTTRLSSLNRCDELLDLLVGRPALEPAVDRLGEQRAGERRGLRVDDAHDVAAELLGRPHGGLVRPRELRREVERPDPREPRGASSS